jgi:WD40 repeat protein
MSIRELSVQSAHSDAVWSVSWPESSTISTGGVDALLKIWNVTSGEEGSAGGVKVDSKPRLTANGQTVLSAAAIAEGQVLPVSASLSLLSVVSVPNSSLVVTSSMDGSLRIYDTAKGEHIRRIDAGSLESWTICVDPTGQYIATGTRSGVVHVFSLTSGERLATLLGDRAREGEAVAAWVSSVAWSRDGRHLAAGHFDGRVSLWNMQGATALAPAKPLSPHAKAVRALQFSADGALLFSGGDDMHVHWYDTSVPAVGSSTSGQLIHDLFAHGSWVTAIDVPFASNGVVPANSSVAAAAAASAQSSLAASTFATVSTDRKLKIWSLLSRECIATHELDSPAWSVTYDPLGERVAVGTENGTLAVFQVPTTAQ